MRVGAGWRSAVGVLLGFGALLVAPAAAGADVVSPAGACVGSGTWRTAGLSETSTAHVPSDVVAVPRADTVRWSGNVKGYALGSTGARRAISGEVQLDLPVGTATIDSWGGSSVRYANEGEHVYDLPSVLVGIKMRLHGEHRENGAVVCGGSVYVKVTGSVWSNPLSYGSLGVLAISGGVLVFAGRPVFRKKSAYEDVNPG
jgi:hypothetical protein